MQRAPHRRLVSLCACVLLVAGCELTDTRVSSMDPDPGPVFSYENSIQPIFDARCTGCHGALTAEGGLRLDTWAEVVAGSDAGEAIIPFSPDESLLYELLTRLAGGAHPTELAGDTVTVAEIELIRRWIEEGARAEDGTVPFEDVTSFLYVANQDDATVSVIDFETNQVARVVDLQTHGFSAAAKPHHVAVEPDGSHWYVSLIGENTVARFNRANELVGQAEFETPGMVALHPAADLLYVGRSLSAPSPPSSIGKITRSDMSVEEVAVVFPRPHALAVAVDGSAAYTASLTENQIITIRTSDDDVGFTPLSGNPHSFVQHAVSPVDALLISTGALTNQLLVFDTTDPLAPSLVETLSVPTGPWHPTFTRDGAFVYVGNKDANTVTIVQVDALIVRDVVFGEGLSEPHGAATSPDGRYVYISNRNTGGTYVPRYDLGDNDTDGTVVVLDTATQQIVKVIEVGAFAAGLGAP